MPQEMFVFSKHGQDGAMSLDTTNSESIADLVAKIKDKYGKVRILNVFLVF